MGLGIPGPEMQAKSKLDPTRVPRHDGQRHQKHPQIRIVATTLREVHSTNRHRWGAVAWIRQTFLRRPANWTFSTASAAATASRRDSSTACSPANAAGSGQSRMGARRAAYHVSRRHHDGDAGAGAGVCQRRLGAHPAVTIQACASELISRRRGELYESPFSKAFDKSGARPAAPPMLFRQSRKRNKKPIRTSHLRRWGCAPDDL